MSNRNEKNEVQKSYLDYDIIIWSLTKKKNVGKTMSAKLLLGVFCQNCKDWMHHYVIVKLKSTQYSNYNIEQNKILIIKHKFPVQMYFIKCNTIYIQGKAAENWFDTGMLYTIIEYD